MKFLNILAVLSLTCRHPQYTRAQQQVLVTQSDGTGSQDDIIVNLTKKQDGDSATPFDYDNDQQAAAEPRPIQSPSLINTRQRNSLLDIDCSHVQQDLEYSLFWVNKIENFMQKSINSDLQFAMSKQTSQILKQSQKLLKNGCKYREDRFVCSGSIVRKVHENFEKSAQFLGQNGPQYLWEQNPKINELWHAKSAIMDLKHAQLCLRDSSGGQAALV